jgi:hypothetical protein
MSLRDPFNGQQVTFARTDTTGRYIVLTVEPTRRHWSIEASIWIAVTSLASFLAWVGI